MAAEIHNVSHVEPASAMALVGEGGSITTSLFRTPGRLAATCFVGHSLTYEHVFDIVKR